METEEAVAEAAEVILNSSALVITAGGYFDDQKDFRNIFFKI